METEVASHADIFLRILEWAWLGLVAVMGWFARKVLGLEVRMHHCETRSDQREKMHAHSISLQESHYDEISKRLQSIEEHLRNGRSR